jgi:hypothetical protein
LLLRLRHYALLSTIKIAILESIINYRLIFNILLFKYTRSTYLIIRLHFIYVFTRAFDNFSNLFIYLQIFFFLLFFKKYIFNLLIFYIIYYYYSLYIYIMNIFFINIFFFFTQNIECLMIKQLIFEKAEVSLL